MIFIGIGGNLPSAVGGSVETCQAALRRLEEVGIRVNAVSPWYETAPVPASDQPWFVNGVACVETDLAPEVLLAALHAIEDALGRVRTVADAARPLDLDLLAYGDVVRAQAPVLPHPRMHLRAFVMMPLADLAPGWRHPVLGSTAMELMAKLPAGQGIRPLSMGAFART